MSATQSTSQLLRSQQGLLWSAGLSAFTVYFCMYAFRKPFAVATFDDMLLWGISYKVVLILAQVIGYASSKFIGIKVIAELQASQRAGLILGLVAAAELALLGFALLPAPFNVLMLFLNGLPLGMVWGVVFSYLEGRRLTEALSAILCVSFIVASGVTKSVGKFLLENLAVSEFWMPFATGLVFVLPLIIALRQLDRTPPPYAEDIAARHARQPMSARDRRELLWQIWPGIVGIMLMYFFLTAFRDYRDNFAAEIWREVGRGDNVAVFAQSELVVAVIALFAVALFVLIRNNIQALKTMIASMIVALLALLAGTWLYQESVLRDPLWWMVLIGAGTYIAYIPVNGALFDRLVASFEYRSNAGFLIYVADAAGYLGSVGVLFYKEVLFQNTSVLDFFIMFSYVTGLVGVAGLCFAYLYFARRIPKPQLAAL